MAINVSFAGSTIYKPGAYSKTKIDLGGGFPLSPTGLVAIMGEAEGGMPGSDEINIADNYFSPDQMQSIRDKYVSGPIVDACNFLFSPGADGAIPAGAQAVYIYKTNASVQASKVLPTNFGTVKAIEYGTGGNRISIKNVVTDETVAEAVSTAAKDLTTPLFAFHDTFKIRVDGSKLYTFEFPAAAADIDTVAELDSALNLAGNWTPSKPTIDMAVSGSNAAAIVTFSMPDTNTHLKPNSRTFELVDGVGTPLAKLNIVAGFKVPANNAMCTLTVNQKRDLIVESDILGGNIVLSAVYYNAGTNATDDASIKVEADKVTLTDTNGSAEYIKAEYTTLNQMIADMSIRTGWTISVASTAFGVLSPDCLDLCDIKANSNSASNKPARIYKNAYEVSEFFAASQLVVQDSATATAGLPDALSEVALTGGAKGATLSSEITNALTALEKVRVNSVIPLFSRDATDDISDFLTDDASTYTIDAIHQAVKSHLSKMATIKNRSERQGYFSIKDSWTNCKEVAATIAYERGQLFVQEVKQIDSLGVIKWFQPWALACIVAGARAGSPIGLPMTYKFMNISGARHTGTQLMTTPESAIVVDFDPDLQYEDAILNGISFVEAPQTGGFRLVLDNTTYNRDANWVLNRGNVLYAADVLAYDFRNQLERIYVGLKNTVRASEVKVMCESILGTYLSQGITVSTPDARNGFKDLIVQINGNTINISVTVKLVEGIDFVLADITVQRAQQ